MNKQRYQHTSNNQSNEKTNRFKQTMVSLLPTVTVTVKNTQKTIRDVFELPINLPVMNAVWRERRELEQLSDEHISDIGLNPDLVRIESRRSFFDIPEERRKSYRKTYVASYEKCF